MKISNIFNSPKTGLTSTPNRIIQVRFSVTTFCCFEVIKRTKVTKHEVD